MKKTIVLLAVGLSLVLLLGSIGPRLQIHDPNSEPYAIPCSISRERILKYEVVVASDPNTLATKVTEKLKGKDNWILIGGISVGDAKCHQAMVMVTK